MFCARGRKACLDENEFLKECHTASGRGDAAFKYSDSLGNCDIDVTQRSRGRAYVRVRDSNLPALIMFFTADL